MKKTKHGLGKESNLLKCIGVSVAISVLFTIICAAVIAGMVQIGSLEEQTFGGLTMMILGVSACIGCMIGGKSAGEKYWFGATAAVAVYYLVLVSANIVLFDGMFPNLLFGTLAVILGAAVSVVMKYAKKSGGGKGNYRYRYR